MDGLALQPAAPVFSLWDVWAHNSPAPPMFPDIFSATIIPGSPSEDTQSPFIGQLLTIIELLLADTEGLSLPFCPSVTPSLGSSLQMWSWRRLTTSIGAWLSSLESWGRAKAAMVPGSFLPSWHPERLPS